MKLFIISLLIFASIILGAGCAGDDSAMSANNANNVNNTNNANNTNFNNLNNINNTNNTNNNNNSNNNIVQAPGYCKNSADSLIGDICVRDDFSCDTMNGCEFGYGCSDSGQCECVDPNICGITCDDYFSCPDSMQCDMETNSCKEPLKCISDGMCGQGEECVQVEMNVFQCESNILGFSDGAQCEDGFTNDCASGICSAGICVPSCRSNDDCSNGTLCSQVLLSLGCVTTSGCDSCTGPGQFCYNNNCFENSCLTGTDCDSGDCMISIKSPQVGACSVFDNGEYDGNLFCNPNEFRDMDITDEVICLLPDACWTNESCPDGYECLTEEALHTSNLGSTGYCGRKIQ